MPKIKSSTDEALPASDLPIPVSSSSIDLGSESVLSSPVTLTEEVALFDEVTEAKVAVFFFEEVAGLLVTKADLTAYEPKP
ncbi:hypothetical protein RIF29_28994 [Crotalaria pallida]|uniref:Uncharacterized protein n=1 Tax=Crotalaria pallida TaxID=3830 RepID=A0AAN9HZX9_CROPI